MSGAVPRVRAVFCIVQQRFKEWRLNTFQITFGFANDVARHKLGRVFKHVNKPMQLAQDVVGQVAAGFGFTVDVDRHIGVFAAHFFNKGAQVQHRRVQVGTWGELFIVNRQNKCAGTALLLGKLAQIAVAGDPQDFKTLSLNGLRHGTNAQARGVF